MAGLNVYRLTTYNKLLSTSLDICKSYCNSSCNMSTYAKRFIPSKSRRSMIFGITAGVGLGVGYSYFKMKNMKTAILNPGMGTEPKVLKSFPNVPISREVSYLTDSAGLNITLFQYATCPFCCKVRAFLDFNGLSYNIVEVNPVLRQQLRWSDYKKVPILLLKTDGGYLQLNDSTMIISALSSYLNDKGISVQQVANYYPTIHFKDNDGNEKNEILNKYFLMYQGNIPEGASKESIVNERKWRKWTDDVFVHSLSPNVYRTRDEAVESFSWFSEVGEWEKNFSAWERYLVIYFGAFAMWIIGKRLKKKHNLKNDVRESLYDNCNYWLKELKLKGTTFHGGTNPNLADLAVYGVLSSIEGCSAFEDLIQNTKMGPWYYSVKEHILNHSGNLPAR